MPPKISYVSLTCRGDYPYEGRPDLHLFHPTFDSLKQQSDIDFEWVIVDALYDERPDYFSDSPFPIKHVPAAPNFWHRQGLFGLSRQYNKGIIYADGELVFFGADGWIFPENFMATLWQDYLKGDYPMAWYMLDLTFSKTRQSNLESPVPYSYYGYEGRMVEMDHRWSHIQQHFRRDLYPHDIWTWFFSGCASVPLEILLELNGFDQNMDGDKMLMDIDLGSRLEMAGHANFLIDKDLYLIRCCYITKLPYLPKVVKGISIKCNYGLLGLNRQRCWIAANKHIVTTEDIDWIMNEGCPTRCESREFCRANHPWQYPFIHRKDPDHAYWFKLWMDNQELIDLEEERELRLENDDKYSKGTYIE